MSAITLAQLMGRQQLAVPSAYTERDTMLYALAIGMGHDPMNEAELDFVYERRGRLKTVPTQAITVARHMLIFEVGMQVEKFLHGQQRLVLHRPLPPAAELLGDHRVLAVQDKGADKGILVQTLSQIRLRSGEPLFDIDNLYFCRGDGGIGSSGTLNRPTHTLPERAPDLLRSCDTLAWLALLYRLTGDRNVIHADPAIAKAQGFQAPILQGSCTMALACREVISGVLKGQAERIRSFGARFTAVVYPGDRLQTEIWLDGPRLWFRCSVPSRQSVVLDQGLCELAEPAA